MKQALNPQESLHLITEMIQKAKSRMVYNGHLYLVWGWLVFFTAIVHFGLQYFYPSPYIVWLITIPFLIYSIIHIKNKKRESKVKTHYDEIISGIWIVTGIMFLMIYYILIHTGNYNLIITCILLLYGLPVMLMGILFKFTPLKTGALICWALAIASLFIENIYHPLFISAAMLAAWIRPGYLMRKEISK